MDTQTMLNKISLLRAHAMEAMKIADTLTVEVSRDSKPKRQKNSVLSDEWKARFLAKKNRKVPQRPEIYLNKKTTSSQVAH